MLVENYQQEQKWSCSLWADHHHQDATFYAKKRSINHKVSRWQRPPPPNPVNYTSLVRRKTALARCSGSQSFAAVQLKTMNSTV